MAIQLGGRFLMESPNTIARNAIDAFALLPRKREVEPMTIESSIVFNFREPDPVVPEEGGTCPSCNDECHRLVWHSENCSCHIIAPCTSCEDASLRCNACGSEFKP